MKDEAIDFRAGMLVGREVTRKIGTLWVRCDCDCGGVKYVKRGAFLRGKVLCCDRHKRAAAEAGRKGLTDPFLGGPA